MRVCCNSGIAFEAAALWNFSLGVDVGNERNIFRRFCSKDDCFDCTLEKRTSPIYGTLCAQGIGSLVIAVVVEQALSVVASRCSFCFFLDCKAIRTPCRHWLERVRKKV